jgi:HAD superfamily hydrolase (TIGR01509 family)
MQLGAIFDFDGVLFHSDLAHEACWRIVAESEGRTFSRTDFLKGFGVKNERFISEILGWTTDPKRVADLAERKEKLFQDMVRKEGLAPIPGTVDLVSRLVEAKIPCAIGSSAMRANIDIVMAPYPKLRSAFSVCVTGEEVHKGKPDPHVFLLAAKRLHLPPSSCVVFEDAPLGVEAGKRAGMKVIALTTSFSEEELRRASPDLLVQSLASVSLQDLYSLIG